MGNTQVLPLLAKEPCLDLINQQIKTHNLGEGLYHPRPDGYIEDIVIDQEKIKKNDKNYSAYLVEGNDLKNNYDFQHDDYRYLIPRNYNNLSASESNEYFKLKDALETELNSLEAKYGPIPQDLRLATDKRGAGPLDKDWHQEVVLAQLVKDSGVYPDSMKLILSDQIKITKVVKQGGKKGEPVFEILYNVDKLFPPAGWPLGRLSCSFC
ncbi:MAG: hypothetical protein WCG27_06885 [Pseudomonadota bacterium]